MKSKNSYTILIVDDEPVNLESLERTFHKDYQVFSTTSAGKALNIFRRENIHLIIADQRMPEMTGIELLEKIKKVSPHPIRMVLSAYTDVEYLINAINRGEVYRYITKPWEPDELRITIRKALEHYQANMDRLELTQVLRKRNAELDSRNKSLQAALKKLGETQEKLVEMERFSMVGKMAGMIIHDLKQPLDIIRSAAETMARVELETPDRQEFSAMIKFEVERFLELIQDLLDYTRGIYHLDLNTLLLSDFLALTETRIQNYLRNYEIDFRVITDEQDAHIRVDRHRFQRALINLIKNSLEAFKQYPSISSPRIILRTSVTDDFIIFNLEDNGPGIPDEFVEDIFKPFVSNKKKFGIGLGLTIVRNIIEQHGGTIGVDSVPGEGSVVTIRMQKMEPQQEAEAG